MTQLYQNNRIRIRPYCNDDLDGLYECVTRSIPEMKPFLPWVHDNYKLNDSQKWITWAQANWRSGLQYDFVIEEIATNTFLGGVGLLAVNRQFGTAELGYWLRTDYTGKGITFEATCLAVQFAKAQLKLNKLIIFMPVKNVASKAIAVKLGARYIETKQRYQIINQVELDCEFYLLDLSEYKSPLNPAIVMQ